MRVLVTGSRGRVGAAAAAALSGRGYDVFGTDLSRPVYELPQHGVPYVQADLRDAGDAFAVVRGHDAVVHCAAIPTWEQNTAHSVFSNNILSTFNVAEAAVSSGVRRMVNISSAAVAGYGQGGHQALPRYLPRDEDELPCPREVYGLAKHLGEQVLEMVWTRSGVPGISLRPSWVQHPGDYGPNLGAGLREPVARISRWSYVDIADLVAAIVLAVESDLPGHEVFHVAAADNPTGRSLQDLVSRFYGERIPVRPTARPDASAVSVDKAHRLLGFTPTRSWRDHLEADGTPLPAGAAPSH